MLILLRIAFVTLFERKILSYSQNRLGPNKVFFVGIVQPIMDGLKLLIKENFSPFKNFYLGFILGPFVGFLVIAFLWLIFEPLRKTHTTFFVIIFIFTFIGIGVYSTLISG